MHLLNPKWLLMAKVAIRLPWDEVSNTCHLSSCSLAWEGRIVVMGFAGGKIPSIPANLLLLKNVSAMGVYWSRYQQEDFPLFSSAMSSLLQYGREGKIRPYIGAVFKLEEVHVAQNC